MTLHLLLPALLVAAKICGALARRLGVPSVVGEIVAGLLVGPALLDWTGGLAALPADDALLQLAQIGLCVLLFRVGLETRIDRLLGVAAPASIVAVGGMLVPLMMGSGLALLWGLPGTTALFLGAALTATSIGVTASVLAELRAESSPEASVIVGAAVLDNVLGLVLLSALVGTMTPADGVLGSVAWVVLEAFAFLGIGLSLGPAVARLAVRIARWSGSRATLLVLVFSCLLLWRTSPELRVSR